MKITMDKEFTPVSRVKETRIPANAMLCPGSCESCGMCWYLKELGRDTKFIKH